MGADPHPLSPAAAEALCRVGRDAGLAAVGIARAEPFTRTRHDLEERREAGLHGGMAFTYRRPERSADPTGALPDARALVVGAWAYPVAVDPPPVPPAHGPPGPVAARVARYATHDHYDQLRSALGAVAERLRSEGWRARVLVDDNALVDREAAQRAGLGWYGRSANLLVPGHGPWVVLGSVLTDAPLPATGRDVPDGCGTCRRCIDACPTGAIVADGVVDARRCLSWRLQDTGIFPRELRTALGDRIYGCDECLEVCPPGRRAPSHPGATEGDAASDPSAGPGEAAGTRPAAPRPGVGGRPPGGDGTWVDLLALLAAGDDDLLDRHGRWYVPRRDAQYLRRNALVVLANVGDPAHPGVREAVAAHLADDRPVVRAHAVWAARRLGFDDLWPPLVDDPDPAVQAEATADVGARTVGEGRASGPADGAGAGSGAGGGSPGSVPVDLGPVPRPAAARRRATSEPDPTSGRT
jgi:epoxyqueuosine reductase